MALRNSRLESRLRSDSEQVAHNQNFTRDAFNTGVQTSSAPALVSVTQKKSWSRALAEPGPGGPAATPALPADVPTLPGA